MFRSVILGFGSGNFFAQVACAGNFSFVALKSSGLAYSWGAGSCGVLGNSSTSCNTYPQSVCCDYKYCFISGSSGCLVFIGIKSDGKAVSWGQGSCGVLGNGSTNNICVPTPICCDYCYKCITPGYNHVIAIKSDNKLVSWGQNSCGQLGDGSTTDSCQPVAVCCDYNYINISAKINNSYGVRDNCKGYSWGSAYGYSLGDCQNFVNKCVPSPICCDYNYCKIFSQSSGSFANFAIKTDGTSVSWGLGCNYVLGNGSTNQVCVPSAICCTYSFKCFIIGYLHVVALTTEGKLVSWGSQEYGQLGNGVDSTNDITIPTLACCTSRCYCSLSGNGQTHAAVGTDGCFYTWGINSFGSLGNSNSPYIVCIPTLTCSF